jgi:hypothetical protein
MTLRVAGEAFTTMAAVRASETCGCVNESEPSDAELQEIIDAASDVLALATGGIVTGRTEFTVRPCGRGYCQPCACCGLEGIPLPGEDPVVSEVKIDGDILNASDYALHRTRQGWNLVRVGPDDPPASWPQWQKLWRADTEDDTFSITYISGIHIDWIIEAAAIELTCDLALAEERKPRVIPGARAVSQGGVTISLAERAERLRSGDSGPAVQRFLSIYAPDGRAPSLVWAPELDQGWELHVIV